MIRCKDTRLCMIDLLLMHVSGLDRSFPPPGSRQPRTGPRGFLIPQVRHPTLITTPRPLLRQLFFFSHYLHILTTSHQASKQSPSSCCLTPSSRSSSNLLSTPLPLLPQLSMLLYVTPSCSQVLVANSFTEPSRQFHSMGNRRWNYWIHCSDS